MGDAAIAETFPGYIVRHGGGAPHGGVGEVSRSDLAPDGAIVRVEYSSVNFKDALAALPDGKVARISPLVLGIDLAGTVVSSPDPDFPPGSPVLAHGYGLGVSRHGGYARYASVPPSWLVPMPEGMSSRDAMAIGTAGFTAAMSVDALQRGGCGPDSGDVLVTGATGGVGSVAVAILAAAGYTVVASTGKEEETSWLKSLGAAEVIGRDAVSEPSGKPLGPQRWAAAVDCVGGATLEGILRGLCREGVVAVSGLVGGSALNTTVLPFILRGVSMVGMDSAEMPIERRRALWKRLAGELSPGDLGGLVTEIGLDGLTQTLGEIAAGKGKGRVVVAVGD